MKASPIFSPGDDSTRITLLGTFILITEKNTTPFLWCQRLICSVPSYPVFIERCRQRDTLDWMPGLKGHSLQDGCRVFAWRTLMSRASRNTIVHSCR
ncbi:hypothetical protein TNCV_3163581 [Trichonephila clavipes]|nr:hypothetical protein TNCV_3163581 [Trichonephila clavipes]